MAKYIENDDKLVCELYDKGAIKFGEFTLKSGIKSPIYIDFRVLVSYPDLMENISSRLFQLSKKNNCDFSRISGVPYTALPIATVISISNKIPMLIMRKEAKEYGTKKIVEGAYTIGEKCLIVEDIITTGGSVIDATKVLRNIGLEVTEAVVILDREQGAVKNLRQFGISVHSLFTVTFMLKCLSENNLINGNIMDCVLQFIHDNQLNYKIHPMTAKLWKIISEKKSNLCISLDVCNIDDLLNLADQLGPHVCIVKVHSDIIEGFNLSVGKNLRKLAEKHNFLIFEDRKFADIGKTVTHQFCGGNLKICEWVDIVNVHALPGPTVIQSIKEKKHDVGILIVAEMSTKENLLSENYTNDAIKLALANDDCVMGFIAQKKLTDNGMIVMTPGVHLDTMVGQFGQQYNYPETVVNDHKSDVVIVGSGILNASNCIEEAIKYKERSFTDRIRKLAVFLNKL